MYHCLCCGYRTVSEQPPGTYQICPVCFWEDDDVQAADPDYPGGANHVSLRDARATFQQIGVSKQRAGQWVRSPTALEQPGIRMADLPEPIDLWLRTKRPGGGHPSAVVNEIMEELAYWDAVVAINLLPYLEGFPVNPWPVDIAEGLAAFMAHLNALLPDQLERLTEQPDLPQRYWDRVVQLLDQPDSAEGRLGQFRGYLELLMDAWVAWPSSPQ
jgi:hypothetical protein